MYHVHLRLNDVCGNKFRRKIKIRSHYKQFIAINEEQILAGIVGIQCCQGIPNIVPAAAAAVRQGCSMGILDVRVELVAIG